METDIIKQLQQELSKCREKIVHLKFNEKEYRNLFQFMGEGFIRADKEGKIVMLNNAALEITGYDTLDELKGKSMSDLYADPKERKRIVEELKGKKEIRNMEFLLRQKNNTLIWTLCTIKLRFSEEGENIGTEGIFRDIHERKQAQNALKERVKELNGLCQILTIAEDSQKDLKKVLQEIVEAIPPACRFPEICEAMIQYKDISVHTKNYVESNTKIEKSIEIRNFPIGKIIVVYLNYPTDKLQESFLPEEERLLKIIAEHLGKLFERKSVEKELEREREAKYYRLVEGLPNDIVYVHSKQKGVIFCSESLFEILKISKEEFYQDPLSWNNMVHPEDKERLFYMMDYLKEGDVFDIEYRIINTQGKTFWFRDRGFNVRKENSDLIIEGVAYNITNRKLAEIKQEESEEALRLVIENIPYAVFAHNLDGELVIVNKTSSQYTGYTGDELLKMKVNDIDKGSISRKDRENIWAKLQYGDFDTFLAEHHRKNGSTYPVEISLTSFKLKNQPVLLAVAQDITKRLQTEKELRESEEKYRLLAENMIDMVAIHEADGTYSYVSPSVKVLLGYSPEELIGKNPYMLFHPEDQKRVKEKSHEQALQGKVVTSFEYRIKNNAGDFVWFNTNTKPLYNEKNQLVGLQTVSRDITEQKKAQKLKNDLIVAQQSAKLKERFLANMSHEMRTPMNGIIGMTEFLSETKLNNKQKDFVDTIKESSESLLHIINDVLSLSKIEQGMVELDEDVVCLQDIFNHTINLFKAEAKRKNIRIKYFAEDDLPSNLMLDAQNLRQVLYNIVSNALKYTEKGEVNISVQLIDKMENNVKIKVVIEDTGLGIPEQDCQRIFDPFVRLDDEFTKTTEGTGLGLTIAKNLVEIMGGNMGVESKPNQGSRFWFTFQSTIVDENENQTNNSPTKELEDLKLKAHILIAEDKILNQKVAGMMLNNFGCTYEIAENGKKVLELFEENKFDVILMDIMMPEMDGIEAMKQLRKHYRKVPPIIGLSAQALEGDAEKYMNMGMDDYLEKPINKNKLAEKLLKWIGKD
jgi:PAS domain S-box-containing protein